MSSINLFVSQMLNTGTLFYLIRTGLVTFSHTPFGVVVSLIIKGHPYNYYVTFCQGVGGGWVWVLKIGPINGACYVDDP